MEYKILGSGGAIPTPRPFTNGKLSKLARKDKNLERDCSCFWIEEIKTLIDCPETVSNSANKAGISNIDNLFITHRHPDHSFGLRLVLESKYDFYQRKTDKPLNLYLPKTVYEDIKKVYPSIDFFVEVKKCAKIYWIEDNKPLKIKNVTITPIGYTYNDPHRFAYQFEKEGKKLVYLPCDTIIFEKKLKDVDVLIHECGIFSPEVEHELSFKDLILRLQTQYQSKKTIFTHIEEIELERRGIKHLEMLEQKYKELNIQFAFDGMEIKI